MEAALRPRLLELLDEDFAPERVEPEDFVPERLDEDFFAEERPVVRLEEPRPEDGPAVRPVDFAEELRDDEPRDIELRLDELRAELDLPEEDEPDRFDDADFEPDLLAVDLLPVDRECDFELGLEEERLELLPVREDDELPARDDFEELLPPEDFDELLPRAFSG